MLLLSIGFTSAAADPLVLLLDSDKYTAAGYLSYLEDEKGSLSIADVRKPENLSRFTKGESSVLSFGVTRSVYWFGIKLKNPENHAVTWWMELQDPLLDSVDIYYARATGVIEHARLGDHFSFEERQVRVRNPVSVIELHAEESLQIFIRIKTYGLMSAPVYFWKPQAYPTGALNLQMEYGIYYGIIAALFLYNIMLFISIRDRSYLYYCLFVVSYALWQFCYNGLSYQYLWPNHGQINLTVALSASAAYAFFVLLFARSFLHVPVLFPRLNKLMIVAMAFVVVPLTMFFFFSKSLAVQLNALFATLSMLFVFFVGIYALYKGVQEARYFLLAWLTLIVGVSVFNMMLVGWLPSNFLTIHGQQIGSALEAVLLSFALAHRMRLLMQENERIRMDAKEMLEKKVVERTKELDTAMHQLEDANLMLRERSISDGLTGVKNRLYLEEQYEKEWHRAYREKQDLALLMIDIDHFKKVNDQYGHLCGDHALCFVAGIIKSVIRRPGDIIARYGGEEFLVVLPNTGFKGAFALAEKVRVKLEETNFEFNDVSFKLTASIGYAVQNHSVDYPSAKGLIDAADQALYMAKHNGRNQVVSAVA